MNYPEPIFLQKPLPPIHILPVYATACPNRTDLRIYFLPNIRTRTTGKQLGIGTGANLLFSFVVYPSFLEAGRQFFLSQITALALTNVLSDYTEDICIKWPNDIYWKDKNYAAH